MEGGRVRTVRKPLWSAAVEESGSLCEQLQACRPPSPRLRGREQCGPAGCAVGGLRPVRCMVMGLITIKSMDLGCRFHPSPWLGCV